MNKEILILISKITKKAGNAKIFIEGKYIGDLKEVINLMLTKRLKFNIKKPSTKEVKDVLETYNNYEDDINYRLKKSNDITHVLRYNTNKQFNSENIKNNTQIYQEILMFDKIESIIIKDQDISEFVIEGTVCIYGKKIIEGFYDINTDILIPNDVIKERNMIIVEKEKGKKLKLIK